MLAPALQLGEDTVRFRDQDQSPMFIKNRTIWLTPPPLPKKETPSDIEILGCKT